MFNKVYIFNQQRTYSLFIYFCAFIANSFSSFSNPNDFYELYLEPIFIQIDKWDQLTDCLDQTFFLAYRYE